jgi:hypothetical protein
MAEEHTLESPRSGQTDLHTDPIDQTKPGSYIATVALVGLGVALLEVELIPGMLIGVAAMLFPKLVPRLGTVVRPIVKSAVRAGMVVTERARETVAEATEQVQDIVAEVRAQHEPMHAGAAGAAGSDAEATKAGASTSGRDKAGRSSESGTEQKEEGRTEESSPRPRRGQPQ